MEIGIFARTFPGPGLDQVLDAVVGHGLSCVHFNLKCAGVESLPGELDDRLCHSVRQRFERRGLRMVAVSGTFNAIHPDKAVREQNTGRCRHLIERCRALGTSVVTLCTGTRDPGNMWRYHPDNATPEAWSDLVNTLEQLLPAAEGHGVVLGIEPEVANVIDSAAKARKLLDQMGSKHLRIILDGANLFSPDELSKMVVVLEEAFDLLGQDVEMIHAKDISGDPANKHPAAGSGALDWPTYFRLMKRTGYDGPVVLHNLDPSQVRGCIDFLRRQAAQWYPG